DRIQQAGGGDVNKEQWTHGSSAERMRWFTTGYNATSIEDCDTFSASSL
ncbi:MAG TPA: peptidase, partial [Nocardioides bacterium]|nr:peptidase [Nocardioides sp.]